MFFSVVDETDPIWAEFEAELDLFCEETEEDDRDQITTYGEGDVAFLGKPVQGNRWSRAVLRVIAEDGRVVERAINLLSGAFTHNLVLVLPQQ